MTVQGLKASRHGMAQSLLHMGRPASSGKQEQHEHAGRRPSAKFSLRKYIRSAAKSNVGVKALLGGTRVSKDGQRGMQSLQVNCTIKWLLLSGTTTIGSSQVFQVLKCNNFIE